MKNQRLAVVGVSADSQKYGYKIFTDLLAAGYQVIGVNPKKPVIKGQQTVATLAEIEQPIDLVIIVTPPEVTIKIIMQASELSMKNLWLQPGAESAAAVKLAQDLKLNLTYDDCFMKHEGLW